MKITKYFEKLNEISQKIFAATISEHTRLGRVHQVTSNIFQFSAHVAIPDEQELLRVVCAQLEGSCLTLTFGMYRQALTSLRLAFEIGLGSVYFSVHKIEHREWKSGQADIKWSCITNEETGIFSARFAKAFFPELSNSIHEYGERAKKLYRSLSEYVHGNSETWKQSGLALEKNDGLITKYFDSFDEVTEILAFILCCRYLKDFSASQLDDAQGITEELMHIASIREFTGGPKEIR